MCAALQHACGHDLRPNERGTFAALGDPRFIDHPAAGSASPRLELLPVHAFVQDRSLLQKGLRNYLGLQNSIGFFHAPKPR